MRLVGLETLHHVDPSTLLMERNIREARPSQELVASIKAVGVLEPITAVRVAQTGELLVRFGHRRTLAACQAKLANLAGYEAATHKRARRSMARPRSDDPPPGWAGTPTALRCPDHAEATQGHISDLTWPAPPDATSSP